MGVDLTAILHGATAGVPPDAHQTMIRVTLEHLVEELDELAFKARNDEELDRDRLERALQLARAALDAMRD